jgi:hypothetical protein
MAMAAMFSAYWRKLESGSPKKQRLIACALS